MTAARWIHRSRWMQPHGRQAANSIGGSKNGKSGGDVYAVQTVVKWIRALIFVAPSV